MKKGLKILFASVLCFCTMFMVACGSINYYNFTTESSDTNLGNVSLGKKVAEGDSIILSAYEENATNNPLYCWVKDRTEIVSESENITIDGTKLTLKSGTETEGLYTAIFKDDAEKMMYATLKNHTLNDGTNNIEDYTYTISYTLLNAGSNDSQVLASNKKVQSAADNQEGAADSTEGIANKKVLYFGSAGDAYQYTFSINVEMHSTDESGNSKTTYVSQKSAQIITSNFASTQTQDVKFEFKDDKNNSYTFTLTLAKLGYEQETTAE